jgi:hypothetical protein
MVLTLLHVSDLHFEDSHWTDIQPVFKGLLDDLREFNPARAARHRQNHVGGGARDQGDRSRPSRTLPLGSINSSGAAFCQPSTHEFRTILKRSPTSAERLHWIDEKTQELLNLLADSIGTAKFLLLVKLPARVFASME